MHSKDRPGDTGQMPAFGHFFSRQSGRCPHPGTWIFRLRFRYAQKFSETFRRGAQAHRRSSVILAYKYRNDLKAFLPAGTNQNDENAHLGALLEGIVSLLCGEYI
jgi:hypothetical protein